MQRGRGAGMSYRGNGQTARDKANASDVELGLRENSAHLDALSDKVSLLKGLTQEIEGEVAGQNRFLDTMGGGLGNAGSALDSTMAALERMSSQGGARFGLCAAGAVVVFFFCLRYAVLTARG